SGRNPRTEADPRGWKPPPSRTSSLDARGTSCETCCPDSAYPRSTKPVNDPAAILCCYAQRRLEVSERDTVWVLLPPHAASAVCRLRRVGRSAEERARAAACAGRAPRCPRGALRHLTQPGREPSALAA